MPIPKNTASPKPYQSLQDELTHFGSVSVTGTALIDLGIGHNNFVVIPMLQSVLATDVNAASDITWNYGTRPGTFVIACWKATSSSVNTLIASTAAVNVSFYARAGSSVG